MNSSESAKHWKIGNWMFQIDIESSCQSVKPKNIYLGLNYFCQLPCKLMSQSQTPHGRWKERLCSMTPRVGSVGVLCDPGAVSAPANASICFQSSGCHLKSLRFIAPGSVSRLSPAADARNWVKVSPLEVLSYTELEELQCYPCMSCKVLHTICIDDSLAFLLLPPSVAKKISLKNAKNFEK